MNGADVFGEYGGPTPDSLLHWDVPGGGPRVPPLVPRSPFNAFTFSLSQKRRLVAFVFGVFQMPKLPLHFFLSELAESAITSWPSANLRSLSYDS